MFTVTGFIINLTDKAQTQIIKSISIDVKINHSIIVWNI